MGSGIQVAPLVLRTVAGAPRKVGLPYPVPDFTFRVLHDSAWLKTIASREVPESQERREETADGRLPLLPQDRLHWPESLKHAQIVASLDSSIREILHRERLEPYVPSYASAAACSQEIDAQVLNVKAIRDIPNEKTISDRHETPPPGEMGKSQNDVQHAVQFARDGYDAKDPIRERLNQIPACQYTRGNAPDNGYAYAPQCVESRANAILAQLESRRSRYCSGEASGKVDTGGVKIDIRGIFGRIKKPRP